MGRIKGVSGKPHGKRAAAEAPSDPALAALRRKLFAGSNRSTNDGLRKILQNADELVVEGDLPLNVYHLLIMSVREQRALLLEAARDVRAKAAQEAAEKILAARELKTGQLRDVGPPPDDMLSEIAKQKH